MHAVRIAVDPRGRPWIINRDHQICRRLGDSWHVLPGRFRELAIGANGGVWALGSEEAGHVGDLPIFNWTGTAWQKVKGKATRIAVAPNGVPWIVTAENKLYRLPDGNEWREVPGRVVAVAIGADGSAWALGPPEERTDGGYPLLRWHDRGWEKFPGSATCIAFDAHYGGPWIVNDRYEVYRLQEGFCWHEMPGMATEIATGPEGSTWAIGRAKDDMPPPIVRWDAGKWVTLAGDKNAIVVTSVDGNHSASGLPVSVEAGSRTVYCRTGSEWGQLPGRLSEIRIGTDGAASLCFEDGASVPLEHDGELYIPDERTRGITIQIDLKNRIENGMTHRNQEEQTR